ncbi:MAG: putative hydrolase [Ilumatobacteraceae bacterium]|nr:putative hydrolase [Ilumatobacteraceae bacterium]
MIEVIHGRVFTSDPERLWAEAVAIEGEHIKRVGDLADVVAAAGPDAVLTDVGTGVVLPGFVDAHSHLGMTGDALLQAPLRTAKDLPEVQRRLREWADARPDAPRILGLGWGYWAVPDGVPTRQMLDAVSTDRPIYTEASDLHSNWVNTRALEELGITADTPDPIGGRIVRDPVTGEATGHLLENASVNMVWPMLADVDDATRDGYLRAALDAYNAAGVTTAVDMALDGDMLGAMQRAETAGALSVRVVGHWLIHRTGDPVTEAAQVDRVVRLVARLAEQPSPRLRVIGIKIIVDGTIDGCTAALINPYANGTNDPGIWDLDALQPVVTAADAAGLQIALHAIGDQAVRNAIDAFEHAGIVNGIAATAARRHRIEHLEYADEADVGRLAALGITASMQPAHADPAGLANWMAMLGDARADRGFAWREFLDAGTTLAFGSDTPTAPHYPLHNMYIAATRKLPSDSTIPPHRPDNALPLEQAVVHATRDAAWASFAEDHVGTIRPGTFADLIVLDSDPFTAAPESLLTARVVRTIVGGHTVHTA